MSTMFVRCPGAVYFPRGLCFGPAVDVAEFGNNELGFVIHASQADVLRSVTVGTQCDEPVKALDISAILVFEDPQFVTVRSPLASTVCVDF